MGCPSFRSSVVAVRLALVFLAPLIDAPAIFAADTTVRVIYAEPLLSVGAHDVPLPVLLREIGQQVGFDVASTDVQRSPITFDVQGATIPEVLRQLLRDENHVILYREEAGVTRIATIVLRGPRGTAQPMQALAGPRVTTPVVDTFSDPGRPGSPRPDPAVTIGQPPVVATAPPLTKASTAIVPSTEAAEANVENLLKAHALGALGQAPAPGVATPSSPDVGDALARTTRAAQQNLKALMEGLDAATESMRATGAIAPR